MLSAVQWVSGLRWNCSLCWNIVPFIKIRDPPVIKSYPLFSITLGWTSIFLSVTQRIWLLRGSPSSCVASSPLNSLFQRDDRHYRWTQLSFLPSWAQVAAFPVTLANSDLSTPHFFLLCNSYFSGWVYNWDSLVHFLKRFGFGLCSLIFVSQSFYRNCLNGVGGT